MRTGVVIPVGGGRRENLTLVMDYLMAQTIPPKVVILLYDGPDAEEIPRKHFPLPTIAVHTTKHQPGMEQPRNVGVRVATEWAAQEGTDLTHIWFLDSDCIPNRSAMAYYEQAAALAGPDVILVGPYDWLPPGKREPDPELRNDPDGIPPPGRWGRFDSVEPGEVLREDLAAGLACFSGNLVWPVGEFERVGGFWRDIHHGRCEDGELGLRAVAMGVGITFVRGARAWHLWHERNIEWILRTNAIDVPKIQERHPWRELGQGGQELFVVEEDGKRFNLRCACGWEGNTALIWNHEQDCPNGITLKPGK